MMNRGLSIKIHFKDKDFSRLKLKAEGKKQTIYEYVLETIAKAIKEDN